MSDKKVKEFKFKKNCFECNSKTTGEYYRCYDCNLKKRDADKTKKKCEDCGKAMNGDYLRCWTCNNSVKLERANKSEEKVIDRLSADEFSD